MKKTLPLLLVMALMLTSACIPCLHPLYLDKDLIFDPALIGTWSEKDSKETWQFTKVDDETYRLVYTNNEGRVGTFRAHLLKLGKERFLDIYPEGTKEKLNELYDLLRLPAHTFFHVPEIQPELKMSCMEGDWLKNFLKKNPDAIRHEIIEDDLVVLTASTSELQAFILAHLEDEGAFSDASKDAMQKIEG